MSLMRDLRLGRILTLPSEPSLGTPRLPKGHGWPGAEALASNPGYQGLVLILKLRFPVGPGSVPQPRVPLLPISNKEIAFPSVITCCGDTFINAWEVLWLQWQREMKKINKTTVVSSLSDLGCDSTKTPRVTAPTCYRSWALHPRPDSAQHWQMDLASTKTTQGLAGSRNVGSRLQAQWQRSPSVSHRDRVDPHLLFGLTTPCIPPHPLLWQASQDVDLSYSG